ncbi:hypothetical protein [Stenotrophomonas indicatrix]|uniref:hypothetical protein n=1 Tax=Stenotrophomonas indicatrix TaxID=2045451 RepID=UPI000FDAE178|nr:hypothetical protein [Stenotrophomonas indicatrix]
MPFYKTPCPDGSPGCLGKAGVFVNRKMPIAEVPQYLEDQGEFPDSCAACCSDYSRDYEGNIIND